MTKAAMGVRTNYILLGALRCRSAILSWIPLGRRQRASQWQAKLPVNGGLTPPMAGLPPNTRIPKTFPLDIPSTSAQRTRAAGDKSDSFFFPQGHQGFPSMIASATDRIAGAPTIKKISFAVIG